MGTAVQLAGKVVAITGGARGIGRAIATAFAAEGAKVAIGDIDKKMCENTAAEIGSGTIGLPLDVTDHGSFEAFFDTIAATVGPVDVIVNNAGIMPITPFGEESLESIQRQLDINVRGVMWGSQLAITRMKPRRGGVIVNIASAAGKMGVPGLATYCATKWAVIGLCESLTLELKDDNISVVCVMPGVVNTELVAGLEKHWLLGIVQPEDIAAGVLKAVRKGKFPVMVPKKLGPMFRTTAMLPRAMYGATARSLGMDHFMLDAHGTSARAAYEDRANHSEPSAE
ncbi:SDR family oxidoreductase [Mycobacterium sp. CBMA271]|uniref:SDR family oxidoreductase n=1 Tax=unclassified Mycobacteroides TaxID=2618759 RepID=UPI0012DF2E1F|nr:MULTISPECIES: SDR family oxidoreductase [unclassified Mycobacteroides]MUM19423.1 short-chain dehydrogenase [Mycobacteroides sp. CBMA 326]MUM21393.1 SDR family oxidoreductase [Mycobacteroides sp. CBMA 271]